MQPRTMNEHNLMDTITYAAAITLYNPKQDYIENVITYSSFFPYVIVNDNTLGDPPYKNMLKAIPNIIYFGDGTNRGLPVAFNRSLQWSREHHIDYLCTLDQDSKLGKEETNAIIAFIESNKDDNTAIVAPSPLFLGIPDHPYDDCHGFVEEVNWTICSGSFLNVKLLFENDIKYDEAYFVDRFDADLSRQIYNKGYKQLILHNVRMPHILGDAGEHSALRNYYIFRNRLYFNKKYYKRFRATMLSFLQTVRHCSIIAFRQGEKKQKFKALIYGYYDYKHGQMGEIQKEVLKKINV